jgi:mRNA interferase MazF
MRTICLARLDKSCPVVVLARDVALSVLTNVTVALISTTVRGL